MGDRSSYIKMRSPSCGQNGLDRWRGWYHFDSGGGNALFFSFFWVFVEKGGGGGRGRGEGGRGGGLEAPAVTVSLLILNTIKLVTQVIFFPFFSSKKKNQFTERRKSKMEFVGLSDQVAEIFTKGLSALSFHKLSASLEWDNIHTWFEEGHYTHNVMALSPFDYSFILYQSCNM